MKRNLAGDLKLWKDKPGRLPAVVIGARQVGKTYAISEFGRENFLNFHYFNFETDPKIADIFEQDYNTQRILRELETLSRNKINLATDLLFLDEIQTCPTALTSLKYFAENEPKLAVIVAGSTLGTFLSLASFPVGKVEYFHLSPFTFCEFLQGTEQANLVDDLEKIIAQKIKPSLVHSRLWDALKDFYVTGGMPRAILQYKQNIDQNTARFANIRNTQKDLVTSYFADFSKHAGKVNAMHIRSVFESIPNQLGRYVDSSVQRFRFKQVLPSITGYSRLEGPISWLIGAGLTHKVKVAAQAQFPLESYTQANIFKLFLVDVGLLGAMLQLPPEVILSEDYGTTKGYFAENYVCQAIVATHTRESTIYSWAEGQSEIEFMMTLGKWLIPIEVKAGRRLYAKSLSSFAKRYNPKFSIKISGMPLQFDKENHLLHLPLYLSSEIPRVCEEMGLVR